MSDKEKEKDEEKEKEKEPSHGTKRAKIAPPPDNDSSDDDKDLNVVSFKGSKFRFSVSDDLKPAHGPRMVYEDMFDLTGHGIFNVWALAATSLFLWYSAIESLAMAYVLTPIQCDLDLTVAQRGLITSGCYIGLVITALCWGGISDRFGRKSVIVPTVLLCVLFSFLSSISTGFWSMFIFRIIVGALLSASFSTVLVYLGEVNTRAYKDKAISWAITLAVMLYILIPALAWAIIPGTWTFKLAGLLVRPWRVFMWIWGLIGTAGVVILLFLPESPRFTYATKGIRAALPAIATIYAWNKRTHRDNFPKVNLAVSSTTIVDIKGKNLTETLHHMALLLRRPMLVPVLITHYCMFIVHLTVFGMYMWLPDIFYEVMQNPRRKMSMCDVIVMKYGPSQPEKNVTKFAGGGSGGDCSGMPGDMYPISIFAEFVFMLPYFGLSLLIHRISKIRIYSVTLGVAQVLFVLSGFIREPISGMVLLIIGTASAASAILTAMAEEVFPTTLRATAMCTMYMAGEFGTVLGTNIMTVCAFGIWWCWIIFILIALSNILSCIWIELGWPDVEKVRREMEDKGFPY